ncbi:MAG: hypothetical protein LBE02_02705 [Spirochaetaceae bacterium]|jgi:hypothetical protein|nr:hypothetical protein [Spirochaetaceae bacterium]
MVIRKYIVPALLCALIPCPVFAQAGDAAELPQSATQVVKTGNEFQISQVLFFPPLTGALRYEVEIQQFSGGSFLPLDPVHTETNSITVSLRAGSYRYRIAAYNQMNLLEGLSNWQDFRILPAVEPVAETYQPFYQLYYDMAPEEPRITVTGRDFSEESEFALVKHNRGYDQLGRAIIPREVKITRIEGSQVQAVLDFSGKALKRGSYDIFIRNPGGLWTTLGKVRVGSRKNMEWTLSAGWSPMIAAFDYDKAVYYDQGTPKNKLDAVNWRGSVVRLGWVPLRTKIGGLGLEAQLMFLNNKKTQETQGDTEALGLLFSGFNAVHLNVLLQVPVNERWQHNLRLGAGIGDPYDSDGDGGGVGILLNLGFSTQYFMWENLYVEGGVDIQFITRVNHLMFRPGLGLGWQFGRWAEWAKVTRALDRGEDPSAPVSGFPKDEFTLALGWAPMIPLGMEYDDSGAHNPYGTTTLLWPFTPLGAYFRAAYLPHRWGPNKLGAELNFYILDYPNRREWVSGGSEGVGILSHVHLGLLYQRKLTEPWQLSGRLGLGISNPYDFGGEYGSDIPLSINAGLSAQYFLWKGLYAEGGLDLFVSLGHEVHWMLHPGIGIGWQFNRDAETGLNLR